MEVEVGVVMAVVVERVVVLVLEVSGYGSDSPRYTLPRIPLCSKGVAPMLLTSTRMNIVPDMDINVASVQWELEFP